MPIVCGHCEREIHFSGEPPVFCGYCGLPLARPGPVATVDFTPPKTDTPNPDPEAVTLAPAQPSPAEPVLTGTSVGGYRLLRPLGSGGMGTVYEAEDPSGGKRVALKLISAEFVQSGDTLERFRQEGRLASNLSHPRCVFVLAADEDCGRPYIVMELMPGDTLQDLVERQGPLPPEQAIAKILDVMDGLQEAHHLGMVHRDVKPSNCFLETDGRVKIGDFGLAKSLRRDAHLTKTGSFLGTPLYASPEQIKAEPVDQQSDVYSVASTLYFLLTGRAPFQGDDTLATMARIVADDPPSLRSLQPQLPAALDKVVLRGLERDRGRRWRNLAEFRKALHPFLPVKPSIAGLGIRFVAWFVDDIARAVILLPLLRVLRTEHLEILAVATAYLVYFGVLEGLWGTTPGKRLMGLRVCNASDNLPPGIVRAFLRCALLGALNVLAWPIVVFAGLPTSSAVVIEWGHDTGSGLTLLIAGVTVIGKVLILAPMRKRNGYRGLHEFLSGTRTVLPRLPQLGVRRAAPFRIPVPWMTTEPAGLPERIGPFSVRGSLRWNATERVLLGEDKSLRRLVWIWLRPVEAQPLAPVRREVSRETRQRWLACGQREGWQWDAFLAAPGCPLTNLVASGEPFSWSETRPLLEELAAELAAAQKDQTTPDRLTLEQVWMQLDGRLQLLDVSLASPESDSRPANSALDLLRQTAVLALEGRPRDAEANPEPIRYPLPLHACRLLNRLVGVQESGDLMDRIVGDHLLRWFRKAPAAEPYTNPEQLQADLEATRERPAEVSRWRRAGYLALQGLLLHVPFGGPTSFLVLSFAALQNIRKIQTLGSEGVEDWYLLALCPAFWIVWAFMARGGMGFHVRGGITLCRADGRRALRLQCAARSLLVWTPVMALISLALGFAYYLPNSPLIYFGLWGSSLALLAGYAVLAILFPSRSLHDYLAGTYVVPE